MARHPGYISKEVRVKNKQQNKNKKETVWQSEWMEGSNEDLLFFVFCFLRQEI